VGISEEGDGAALSVVEFATVRPAGYHGGMTPRRPVLLSCLLGLACGSSNASPSPAPAASSAAVTSDSGASPRESEAGIAPAAGCPHAKAPVVAARVEAAEVDEASGIVASATNADVFWVHNDSGDTARAFAVTRAGKLAATLALEGTTAIDIEDIAIEDAGGQSFLYLADIGDNASRRAEVVIYRVAEPKLAGGAAQRLSAKPDVMRVTYPDGPHDAETLLFDPVTKDLLLATKRLFGGAVVHRVGPFAAGTKVTTTAIATVPVAFATGGDISRDGRMIAIRSYGDAASLWTRAPGEGLAAALERTPCTVPLATETQGEAFGFLADGRGYITVAEGRSPELHLALFE
jgi:hypothetical protein